MPIAKDDWSQTTHIIIDSYTGLPVKVFYKLKGAFSINVGGGLTIRNVIFDAVDSVIYVWNDIWTTFCSENPSENCCIYDVST